MTKLVTKMTEPINQLGQLASDQAGEPRMNTNRHELLSSFISVHSRPFAVK